MLGLITNGRNIYTFTKEKKISMGEFIFFDKEVLSKVGGYTEYRVEGDNDLVMRLKI